MVEEKRRDGETSGRGNGLNTRSLESQVLGHPVIARIRNEFISRLPGLRPETLAPVAGVTGVEEVLVLAVQARKLGGRPVVVDSEGFLTFHAIGHTAVHTFPLELNPEERLIPLVVAETFRFLGSEVLAIRVGERIHPVLSSPYFSRISRTSAPVSSDLRSISRRVSQSFSVTLGTS